MEPTTKTLTLAERARERRENLTQLRYRAKRETTTEQLFDRLWTILNVAPSRADLQYRADGTAYWPVPPDESGIFDEGILEICLPFDASATGLSWRYEAECEHGHQSGGGRLFTLEGFADVLDDIKSGAVFG